MGEECVYCGGSSEAPLHKEYLTGKHGHAYAPPTHANELLALARTFKAETKGMLQAAAVKSRRWDALKEWLRDAKTNSELAEDHVSMVRDLVYLIEKGDKIEEEEPKLEGRALLDRAREKRRAVLSEERYTVSQAVIQSDSRTVVRAGVEVEGEIIGGRVTILSGPSADVDEWLDGWVTLEQLGERWRKRT